MIQTKTHLPLSDLIILLNQRSKHIKFINGNKKKPFSVYLKDIYVIWLILWIILVFME